MNCHGSCLAAVCSCSLVFLSTRVSTLHACTNILAPKARRRRVPMITYAPTRHMYGELYFRLLRII